MSLHDYSSRPSLPTQENMCLSLVEVHEHRQRLLDNTHHWCVTRMSVHDYWSSRARLKIVFHRAGCISKINKWMHLKMFLYVILYVCGLAI
jgi:hypothetical protein